MKRITLSLLCCISLFSCDQQAEQPTEKNVEVSSQAQLVGEGAIAKVGDHFFTEQDIDAEIARMPEKIQEMKHQLSMRKNLLQNIMTRHALAEEARRMGIVDDPLIKARIDSMVSTMLIQALNERMRKKLAPEEAELRQYYQEHQSQYALPEQMRVRHILLNDESQAGVVLKKIRNGADFTDLVRSYSKDQNTINAKGELPPFSRGKMDASFERAAFLLNAEQPISDVVHTRRGYHIIQWIEKIAQRTREFDELKIQITTQLQQQRFRSWVEQMKKDAGFEILKKDYQQPVVQSPIQPQRTRP